MALSHLDGVESFDIKSDISDKASRSSDAEHDIIGTRRCTALIIQDSDGTDDEMHDGTLAVIHKEKIAIGSLVLQNALSLRYRVEIKYRPTKETKKGAKRDADTISVNYSHDTACCTWGQHTNCPVSERALVKLVNGIVTLRSYCQVGKEISYDYLYEESGKHINNLKVSLPQSRPRISNDVSPPTDS